MKLTNIKKQLSVNQVRLLVMKRGEYDKITSEVVKQLSGKSVCYITLNKTFDSLKEVFERRKIDLKDAVFLDAISQSIKETFKQARGCYFVSSPGSLKELSKIIDKFLRHNFEYLIFDSLTTLLVYQKERAATKFVSELIRKVRKSKTKAIFYVLNVEEQEGLIRRTKEYIEKAASEE